MTLNMIAMNCRFSAVGIAHNVDGKRSGKTHEPSTIGGQVCRYVYHVLALRAFY